MTITPAYETIEDLRQQLAEAEAERNLFCAQMKGLSKQADALEAELARVRDVVRRARERMGAMLRRDEVYWAVLDILDEALPKEEP